MSHTSCQPASASDQLWLLLDLPNKCIEHVIELLPANELPCNLRLVTKHAARSFNRQEQKTVNISTKNANGIVVPNHAIAARWGAPGAARGLTLKQRKTLLCYMAHNGCGFSHLTNLAEALGCKADIDVLTAAAGAGHTRLCEQLLKALRLSAEERAFSSGAVAAAAWGGHLETVQRLVGAGLSFTAWDGCIDHDPMAAAAVGGHRRICEWLLGRGWESDWCADTLAQGGHWDAAQYVTRLTGKQLKDLQVSQVAYGCSLEAVKAVCAGAPAGANSGDGSSRTGPTAHQQQQRQACARVQQHDKHDQALLLHCAAASPTPDWQAKVEWLLEQGVEPDLDRCFAAFLAQCEDLPARVAWLEGRGICVGRDKLAQLLGRYGKAGCRQLLQQLLSEGRKLDCYAARDFAARGELQLLQTVAAAAAASREAADRVRDHAAIYGAHFGHMRTVRWAVGEDEEEEEEEEAAGNVEGQAPVAEQSQRSGDSCGGGDGSGGMQQRGASGRGEAGARLRSRLLTGEAFEHALQSGSSELVRWMRGQGCEWPRGALFTAVQHCSEELVEWMVTQEGCPAEVSAYFTHNRADCLLRRRN